MGLHLRRPERGLRQSSTEVLQRQDPPLPLGLEVEDSGEPSRILRRAAGHSANQAILKDNIETFKGQRLAQAGLLVHLLRAGEVLSAAAVGTALEVLMEEAAMAVATGKLKEKVPEEGAI
jgi:hypothetical protein